MTIDHELTMLFLGLLGVLTLASMVVWGLHLKLRATSSAPFVANLSARIKAWWWMCIVFAIAVLSGGIGSLVLFALISFLALREFITVVPTSRADHRALFWVFFIAVPVQYYLVWDDWYGLFVLFIPVYCFLLVPIRIVVAGDCERFLERSAKIQWGLMACVYCISHVPAILKLNIPGYEGQTPKLLCFFVVIVELCDVFQYIWGKAIGKRKVLPSVSPNKTWAGLIGGCASAGLIGMGLWWITPFTPLQALGMALGIGFVGFCGDVTMSAIKRDSQLKDYGQTLPGHGGVLDRVDSLCFAAPLFFHITRFFFCGASPSAF
jgi:phosphatidate cytidylyltransferase